MSEEQKEVYEIKKSCVKQFLIIVCGSFVGCLLALILMGHAMKPKFPPAPYGGGMMIPPAPMTQFHHRGEPAPDCTCKKPIKGDRPAPDKLKAPDKKFNPADENRAKQPPSQFPAPAHERK